MSHKLTIKFAGICTHYRNGVAAGVPHRVVLPDASKFITELVTVTDPRVQPVQQPILYYLMPHFAQLDVDGRGDGLDVSFDGGASLAVQKGDVLAGVRLQVINAVDRGMTYTGDATPSLTSFVHNYTFSTDVVLNGRAAVYFDLYGGAARSINAPLGASQTLVDITTDGPAELLVTPLTSSHVPMAAQRLRLPEGAVTLNVKNLEAVAQGESSYDHLHGAFDFLLHYLTASGDIPTVIKTLTPGMPEKLQSATKESLAKALAGLSKIVASYPRVLTPPNEVTSSCSDSQYP